MLAWDGAGAAPGTGSLGLEPLMESGLKVTEQGERPSELTGKKLLASLGLREEEEREALLRLSSLVALLCRLSVSRSSKDEFHEFRLCFAFSRGAEARDEVDIPVGGGPVTAALPLGPPGPAAR